MDASRPYDLVLFGGTGFTGGLTADYLASHVNGQPAPLQVNLAVIHGYTTVFWWCAGIFAAGAVLCGTLLRRGPLPLHGGAPAEPRRS